MHTKSKNSMCRNVCAYLHTCTHTYPYAYASTYDLKMAAPDLWIDGLANSPGFLCLQSWNPQCPASVRRCCNLSRLRCGHRCHPPAPRCPQ